MKKSFFASLLALGLTLISSFSFAEQIGEVDTAFKLLGANHKVVVEAYDDPKVAGVTCYVSRAKTGGITGSLGLASDTSDASIACRQVGEIVFKEAVPKQEDVFSERLSVLFKKLHIVRMADPQRKVLVYLTYSDKLIDGSPKNSVTAVPVGNVPMKMR